MSPWCRLIADNYLFRYPKLLRIFCALLCGCANRCKFLTMARNTKRLPFRWWQRLGEVMKQKRLPDDLLAMLRSVNRLQDAADEQVQSTSSASSASSSSSSSSSAHSSRSRECCPRTASEKADFEEKERKAHAGGSSVGGAGLSRRASQQAEIAAAAGAIGAPAQPSTAANNASM